jgi:two-component system LytT family response regulator
MTKLRIVIADDERPARSFLAAALRDFEDVDIVGEAENGAEAVEMIERVQPDLVLLDLQMPEVDGIGVVRLLRKSRMPLVAFVTAYDEYAVKAFEVNAVDYLLKPVDRGRLRETLNRAHERLDQADFRTTESAKMESAISDYEAAQRPAFLERVPVRQRDDISLLAVRQIASVVAEGELLHLTTLRQDRFTINYRLKDLSERLDPKQFVRLSRGSLVNIEAITKINPLPGGTYLVTLNNGQQLSASRIQSRVLREQFLKL